MCLNSGEMTTVNFFKKLLEGGEMTKGGNDRGYYGNLGYKQINFHQK